MDSMTMNLLIFLAFFVVVFSIVVFFVALGLFIFFFNLFVARVFKSKSKLTPSDSLIITGLIGDGVYGLIFASLPVAVFFKLCWVGDYGYLEESIPLLWLILDSSSTLFSLLMIIFMTLNRYVAVVKPFKYKLYFRKRNVTAMILFVILITLIFLIAGFSFILFRVKEYFPVGIDCELFAFLQSKGEAYKLVGYEKSNETCVQEYDLRFEIRDEAINFYILYGHDSNLLS